MPPDPFHDRLVALVPKLRVQAMALTRSRPAADDLVQDAVVKALQGRESFAEGTNFTAWVHRILRNTFISNMRRKRESVAIEDAPISATGRDSGAEPRIAAQQVASAMKRLSAEQRDSLIHISVMGLSYEQVAALTGVAVGTAKCRVFRARKLLAGMMAEPVEFAVV